MLKSAKLLLSLICLASYALAQAPADALERGFQTPPNSAKPRVWWHWMNGNITKEGIKLDLEWMNRTGIGGFQNFDAALGTPKVVDQRLTYMTPPWKDAFRYAITLADQLGLEATIAASPGWSESGGPWVKPAHGMKKVVWSETRVEGGKPFSGKLAAPPSVTGPFQDIPMQPGIDEMISGGHPTPPPTFYADTAVIAYRAPEGDVPAESLQPKVTASAGNVDQTLLADSDLVKTTPLPIAPQGQKSWVQFEFAKPETVHAVTIVTHGGQSPMNQFIGPQDTGRAIEASDDGVSYRKVASIPFGGFIQHTVAFPVVKARFFRVSFLTQPPPPSPFGDIDTSMFGFKPPPPPTEYKIAELVLHSRPAVNRFEEKAAFITLRDLYAFATPPVPAAAAIRKADTIDLTSKMRPDGSLDWTPPPGRWVVLRLGYSLLGIKNHPASPEATGLEVDKLNKQYVKEYLQTYLDNYKDAVGSLMGKRGLQYVVTDSWEAGSLNWTGGIIDEFSRRRGYDPRPWLPVLTGRVVESSESSDRFLWDFRKILGELTVENHYDQLTDVLRERGMARYSESHEGGRAFVADGMEVKRTAAVPMSAMWTQRPGVDKEQYGYNADIRESASVAHIYGQNLVAAESLTAGSGAWAWSPRTLKPTADKELAMGLNRFVIHTSVHQPLVDKTPGLSLGPFGQWFTRNETWAEQAKPWVTYLARNSYMLQQGRFAADILYYYGEDSNITAIFGDKSPDVPAGYNFDYVNADALLHRVSVENGRLTTPSGMVYRVLVLDPYSRHMSLPVLRKLRDLVNAGAIVIGPKPESSPSLSDDQAEFKTIVSQLFGSSAGEHAVGKGKVYAGQKPAAVLSALHIAPDFEYTRPRADTNLLYVHRTLPGSDVYWVDNRANRVETVDATFRVEGKEAELWHADTGVIEPASYRIAAGHTTVSLHLQPWETVFVVFRKAAAQPSRTLPKVTESPVATVAGPWKIAFQPNRGAPAEITLDKLSPWNESKDEGVKYFSGAATYTQTINAPQDWFQPNARLWLDLGEVRELAEVSVNGQSLGTVWKTPYRVDMTAALKPGANTVEIKIVNLWVNRLIGDTQPNAQVKYTFTTVPFYRANSPLVPSGLLGPVQVVRATP